MATMQEQDVIPRGELVTLTFTTQEWKYITYACRQMARKREREVTGGKRRPPPVGGGDASFIAAVLLERAATHIYDAVKDKDHGT